MRGMMGKVRQSRQHIPVALNLTALIDLFTILVLFLLFNMASEGEVIPDSQKLKLPESIAEASPTPTVIVTITEDEISVEGVKVGKIEEILDQAEMIIPDLKEELDKHAQKAKRVGEALGTEVFKGKITILGDRLLPFKILEKVMFTCGESEFTNINLAVIQKEVPA